MIERLLQEDSQKYTFEDLKHLYYVGQAYTISGSGRNRILGYKHGVETPAGCFETNLWISLLHDLIIKTNEQDIFLGLKTWVTENLPSCRTQNEIEMNAICLHSMRIFDDPLWIGYIAFNKKYRPEKLSGVQLVNILPHCCNIPGEITLTKYEACTRDIINQTVSCPHCGRSTTFDRLS